MAHDSVRRMDEWRSSGGAKALQLVALTEECNPCQRWSL